MKNLIVFFVFFFTILNAQKIETVKPIKVVGELNNINLTISETGKYILCFDNVQYSTITDIKCVNLGDEEFVNELYNTLIENFKKETPEDFKVKLKDNVLETKFGKALGVKSFSFILYNNLGLEGMSIYLTQKKLNKLFGK